MSTHSHHERPHIVSSDELYKDVQEKIILAASLQGRVAYSLMSIYAVNPFLWDRCIPYKPGGVLLANMLYGTAVSIYFQKIMNPVAPLRKFAIRFFEVEPYKVLFVNMVYGMTIFIYSRPAMLPISTFNRLTFSILGSMMFNYSSMHVFSYLTEHIDIDERPYLLTFLGYFVGRLMMVHLLGYLYHVDSRSIIGRQYPRDPAFEQMYI